jgi:hypothetical protein
LAKKGLRLGRTAFLLEIPIRRPAPMSCRNRQADGGRDGRQYFYVDFPFAVHSEIILKWPLRLKVKRLLPKWGNCPCAGSRG